MNIAEVTAPMRMAWQSAEPFDAAVLTLFAIWLSILIGESIYQWARRIRAAVKREDWVGEAGARPTRLLW